jgi:hypothetical protein
VPTTVAADESTGGAGVQMTTVYHFHGARGGAPEGKRNGNYRHGARTKATIELWRSIGSLR